MATTDAEIREANLPASQSHSLTGKWSVSIDEESYQHMFDTAEEAIAEGKTMADEFWIGQCVSPMQPEDIFNADDWLENVHCHEDYEGEWAEGSVSPSKSQLEELEAEVRKLMASWLDRHELRPTHWNIDVTSIRHIDVNS